MGCSPYFAAIGTHPLVPLDIAEATYLLPPPSSFLSSTDLIVCHAIALQKCKSNLAALHSKVYEARIQAAMNTIEKSLNCKMRPRYTSPLIVISRNHGGAYILCKLNGSVYDRPVAAFHIIPYFARESIPLLDLDQLLDISAQRLQKLEASPTANPEALDDDLMTSQDEDLE
ncbi:hypothetical protein EW146_g9234 [Bondarzewia mesenterica]|uniref:Uncharacterized protein n=1 Tax=Bondarzewia mesenterica TaxID=1095465 RepID=A0A4S4L8D7_9AGAM|nr:hypothetical protein EW146_g9234 [Bondarzewia mesenterica]